MSIPLWQDHDAKNFIKTVRQWLVKNNVSQREFAHLAGTSPATLHKCEKDPTKMSLDTMAKYQRVMATYEPPLKENPESPFSRRAKQ